MNISSILVGIVIVIFGILLVFQIGVINKIMGLVIIVFGLFILFNQNEDKIEQIRRKK